MDGWAFMVARAVAGPAVHRCPDASKRLTTGDHEGPPVLPSPHSPLLNGIREARDDFLPAYYNVNWGVGATM